VGVCKTKYGLSKKCEITSVTRKLNEHSQWSVCWAEQAESYVKEKWKTSEESATACVRGASVNHARVFVMRVRGRQWRSRMNLLELLETLS